MNLLLICPDPPPARIAPLARLPVFLKLAERRTVVAGASAAEGDEGVAALDGRGLARALTGNRAGAIEDLREFVDMDLADDDVIAQRQSWLETLGRGGNPFTPELLTKLRDTPPRDED